MKKYFKILGIAIVFGGILAYFFYKDINKEVRAMQRKDEVVFVFQAGVFKDYNNAIKLVNNINMGRIYHDKNYYRVIIGITHDFEISDKLSNYFNDNNINYYLKEMRVNKNVLNDLKAYEEVLKKTNKKEIIDTINERMLDIFISYLN